MSNPAIKRLLNLGKELICSIYPKKCICCGRTISEERRLCVLCTKHIEIFPYEKRCSVCGLEKKRCRCKTSVFHFSRLVAPFYNIGVAKCGFYRYKLGCHEQYATFFANAMLKNIKEEYADIYFDGVVCVPPSKKRMSKYGFNPAEQLSQILADRMRIEFIDNALLCLESKTTQHAANKTERFENVRGRYIANKKFNGKKLILVDDIMSTGATLDECAKQLLKGGADEVYCVVALITDRGACKISEYAKHVLKENGLEAEETEQETPADRKTQKQLR